MDHSHIPTSAVSRRHLLQGAAVLAGGAALGTTLSAGAGAAQPVGTTSGGLPDPATVAREVRDEFLHGWGGYQALAWGHDQVLPVSRGHQEFFVEGHPIGLTIIEALDTLYVMELDEDLAESVHWIDRHLDFDIDGDFHVFEAIIRVVGGLLAGYLATHHAKLLALCVDLTDRLLPAFTTSPTGMPYQYVNLRTGAVSGPQPPLAEIGTNILEFGTLSRLTGDPKYRRASEKATAAVMRRRSRLGLLGTTLDVETGRWVDPTDTAPNPPVDSFYEYLWGAYKLFGDRQSRTWYEQATAAIVKHQLDDVRGHTWFSQVNKDTGKVTGHGASELAAFYAELLSAGGRGRLGEAYYDSWTSVLDRYPVLPEGIDYSTGAVTSAGNQLRPEYVNSSFDLYLQTGKEKYRQTAYQYFVGMRDNARTIAGYTILDDVTTQPMTRGDLTPAYWFAENQKYLYLMFANSPRFNRYDYVLSTEGKVLRGLR